MQTSETGGYFNLKVMKGYPSDRDVETNSIIFAQKNKMKIFKFGGASVNCADAIKNVTSILSSYQDEKLVVVISAMGKMTNALEKVVDAAYYNKESLENEIKVVENFHLEILKNLFPDHQHSAYSTVTRLFEKIRTAAIHPIENYDEFYDQIVPFGEILSTNIISAFLAENGHKNRLLNARDVIFTNARFRDAGVDWLETEKNIRDRINIFLSSENPVNLIITQGFIGSTPDRKPTTLGREGSDFTASVFAFCTNAEEVVVWKDVAGLLNADPVYFSDTIKIPSISYREAIELSFFGAKILHPKTIKPLQNKSIPLRIKSFSNPGAEGSIIHTGNPTEKFIPFLILKKDQMLISFSTRDFSFITEEKLYRLFGEFSKLNIKVNLMQNSAISFTVCVNHPGQKLTSLIQLLSDSFEIKYNEGLELLTIRHFDDAAIKRYLSGKNILFEQRSRRTLQVAYLAEGREQRA